MASAELLEEMQGVLFSLWNKTPIKIDNFTGEGVMEDLLLAIGPDDETSWKSLTPLLQTAGIACAVTDNPKLHEAALHIFRAALSLALSKKPNENSVGRKASGILYDSYRSASILRLGNGV